MIFTIGKPRFRSHVGLFDYDWTLVRPKDDRTFPKDIDDWQWLKPNIPEYIKELYHKHKYAIYIFTNQSKSWKKDQIEKVLKTLDIPITICIAFDKEQYKPNRALFDECFTEKQREKIKYKKSFFCGDAMGRKNDHSDADLKFAENIGLKCIEPEIKFYKPYEIPKIRPSKIQEIVVMVGYPGSGKSTIAKLLEKSGYVVIHGDEYKTSSKMIKVAKSYIETNKSIIFDATNPSRKKRKEYIDFAEQYNLPVRCIYMSTSLEESLARNNQRENPIPRIVYNIYKKNFEQPDDKIENFKLEIL